MEVNSLFTLARSITGTDENQLTDDNALIYLNASYHYVANRIISRVWESFFWNEFTWDTVAGQNEYSLPAWSATTQWLKAISRLEVKYKNTDSYKKLINKDTISNFTDFSDAYYQDNSTQFFFDVRDGSYFLYPTPTESITGGILISWPCTLVDLAIWGAETTIFPRNKDLRDYHYILAYGIARFWYFEKLDTNRKNDINAEFENGINMMLETIENRSDSILQIDNIRIRNLMY